MAPIVSLWGPLSFLAILMVSFMIEATTFPTVSTNGVSRSPSSTTISPSLLLSDKTVIAKMMNGTLSAKQIRQLAIAIAKMSEPVVKMLKAVFTEFAPDSWVKALNDIPLSTMRCLIRVSTVIGLEQQQELIQKAKAGVKVTPTITNASLAKDQTDDDNYDYEYYDDSNLENASNQTYSNYSEEYIYKIIRNRCPHGFNQILLLNSAINETMRQLPGHVLDIAHKYALRFKALSNDLQKGNMTAVQPTLIEFVQSLMSITVEERQKMGELFPKLRQIITDPRIDQLLNMMINCVNATGLQQLNCSNTINKLMTDIWKGAKMTTVNANAMNSKFTTTTTSISQISRSKRAAGDFSAGGEKALDMPNVDVEVDDGDDGENIGQPGIFIYSPNGEPINLLQMNGPAP